MGSFMGRQRKERALKQRRAEDTTGFMIWEVSCKPGNWKLSSERERERSFACEDNEGAEIYFFFSLK